MRRLRAFFCWGGDELKIEGKIAKADDAKHLVFGWASMAADEDGIPIVDSEGGLKNPRHRIILSLLKRL